MTAQRFAKKIRAFREQTLELSQVQFATLVGMGVATISRIEKDGETTEAHRQLLEGLQDPNTLLRLLRDKDEVLGEVNCKRLREIAEKMSLQVSLQRVVNLQKENSDAEYTGKREFDLDRLIQMVVYFTRFGEWKTKLNKLLFYADFLSFKELGASISGTRYVRGHYGPIPDHFQQLFAALLESGQLQAREDFNFEGKPLEKLFSPLEFRRSAFSGREYQILDFVYQFFKEKSAKEVVDFSHEESAFNEAADGGAISYAKAATLKLTFDPRLSGFQEKSLIDIANELTSKIPMEEFDKLPVDGSINLDHYLYGAPKK